MCGNVHLGGKKVVAKRASGSGANPPHAILSPTAQMRGAAIAPDGAATDQYPTTDPEGDEDLS